MEILLVFQLFKNLIHHRAGFTVFVRQIQYLHKPFAVGVRVFAASFWTVFVNQTVIVGK